jgi:hypothetical protein
VIDENLPVGDSAKQVEPQVTAFGRKYYRHRMRSTAECGSIKPQDPMATVLEGQNIAFEAGTRCFGHGIILILIQIK